MYLLESQTLAQRIRLPLRECPTDPSRSDVREWLGPMKKHTEEGWLHKLFSHKRDSVLAAELEDAIGWLQEEAARPATGALAGEAAKVGESIARHPQRAQVWRPSNILQAALCTDELECQFAWYLGLKIPNKEGEQTEAVVDDTGDNLLAENTISSKSWTEGHDLRSGSQGSRQAGVHHGPLYATVG